MHGAERAIAPLSTKSRSDAMHPNRPTRNAQQVRTLIQNMGRSIDEARSRRLGPVQSASGGSSGASTGTQSSSRNDDSLDMRIGMPTAEEGASHLGNSQRAIAPVATAPSNTSSTSSSTSSSPTGSTSSSTSRASAVPSQTPPPVRSAHEMFSESTPRLKARPKRAS